MISLRWERIALQAVVNAFRASRLPILEDDVEPMVAVDQLIVDVNEDSDDEGLEIFDKEPDDDENIE